MNKLKDSFSDFLGCLQHGTTKKVYECPNCALECAKGASVCTECKIKFRSD